MAPRRRSSTVRVNLFYILTSGCPTSDGGGAAIIASEEFVKKHGLEHKAVEIIGQSMVTDLPGTFDDDKLRFHGIFFSYENLTADLLFLPLLSSIDNEPSEWRIFFA